MAVRDAPLGILLVLTAASCGVLSALGSVPASASKSAAKTTSAQLFSAEQHLIQRCMQRDGFRYWPLATSAPQPAEEYRLLPPPASWAKQHGFGRDVQDALTPNDRYFDSLSQAARNTYALELNGPGPSGPGVSVKVPTGDVIGHSTLGCTASSERALYGNFSQWFRNKSVVEYIPFLTIDQVASDSHYRTAVKAWAACNARASHSAYSSPAAELQHFLTVQPATSHTTETRFAEVASNCAQSTGLDSLVQRLSARFNSQSDAHYAAAISQSKSEEQTALTAAAKVLGSSVGF